MAEPETVQAAISAHAEAIAKYPHAPGSDEQRLRLIQSLLIHLKEASDEQAVNIIHEMLTRISVKTELGYRVLLKAVEIATYRSHGQALMPLIEETVPSVFRDSPRNTLRERLRLQHLSAELDGMRLKQGITRALVMEQLQDLAAARQASITPEYNLLARDDPDAYHLWMRIINRRHKSLGFVLDLTTDRAIVALIADSPETEDVDEVTSRLEGAWTRVKARETLAGEVQKAP